VLSFANLLWVYVCVQGERSRAGMSVLCEPESHSFADSSGEAPVSALLLLLESKAMAGSVPLK